MLQEKLDVKVFFLYFKSVFVVSIAFISFISCIFSFPYILKLHPVEGFVIFVFKSILQEE